MERAVLEAIKARLPHHGTHADNEAHQHTHEHTSNGDGTAEAHQGGGASNSGTDAAAAGADAQRVPSPPRDLADVEQDVLCHEVQSEADGGKLEWRFGAAAVAPLGLAFDRLKHNLCLERRCFLRLHETIAKQVRSCAAEGLAVAELACLRLSWHELACVVVNPSIHPAIVFNGEGLLQLVHCEVAMGLECMQILRPLQAALMFVQAETDPFLPMAVSNIAAAQRSVPGLPKPVDLHFDCKTQEKLFMQPFKREGDRVDSPTPACDGPCDVCEGEKRAKHVRLTRSRAAAAAAAAQDS